MERNRTSAAEEVDAERDGAFSAPRSIAQSLAAALARIEALERREAALRAALVAHGIDPTAALRAADANVAPDDREAPRGVASERGTAAPIAAAARAATRTRAARSLAERLAEEVVSGPATVRLRAAARLVNLAGAGAAPALLVAAREVEGAARAAILDQLGRTGAADAASEVLAFVGDERAEVRAAAIEAAARLVPEAELEALLRIGLEDPDARVRRRTALCAAAVRTFDAGPLLTGLLADPDRQVRRVVCTALGGTRDPMAAIALIGALLDDDPAVRQAAGSAAERLFGERARGIAEKPPAQRTREVARLRAWVAANLVRLAPGGRLAPVEVVPTAADPVERVLDELMDTGHAGAGFEDDLPGWTEENDPGLAAALARAAGGWMLDRAAPAPAADAPNGDDAALRAEAEALYAEAEEAFARAAAGRGAAPAATVGRAVASDAAAVRSGATEAARVATGDANREGVAEVDAGRADAPGVDAAADADAMSSADAAAEVDANRASAPGVDAAADADAMSSADAAAEVDANRASAPGVDAAADADAMSSADAAAEVDANRASAPGVDAAADADAMSSADAAAEVDANRASAPGVDATADDATPSVNAAAADDGATANRAAAPDAGAAEVDAATTDRAAEPDASAAPDVNAAPDADAAYGESGAAAPVDAHPATSSEGVRRGAESAMIAAEDDASGAAGVGFEAIEAVLRAALRGCTDAALAEELGCDEAALAPAIEAHLAEGRLVRRGRKLFLP